MTGMDRGGQGRGGGWEGKGRESGKGEDNEIGPPKFQNVVASMIMTVPQAMMSNRVVDIDSVFLCCCSWQIDSFIHSFINMVKKRI